MGNKELYCRSFGCAIDVPYGAAQSTYIQGLIYSCKWIVLTAYAEYRFVVVNNTIIFSIHVSLEISGYIGKIGILFFAAYSFDITCPVIIG